MTIKEFIKVLERTLTENEITKIDTPSVYLGSSKRIIEVTIRKSEIDHEARQAEGFDSLAF